MENLQQPLDEELEDRRRHNQRRSAEASGLLSLVVGPTDSGKTPWLLGSYRGLSDLSQKMQLFLWGHHSLEETISRLHQHRRSDGRDGDLGYPKENTQVVSTGAELYALVRPDTQVVFVDDLEHFDEDIVPALVTLSSRGRALRVYATGREIGTAGNPLRHVANLLCMADTVEKLQAVCAQCVRYSVRFAQPGTRTVRLVNGCVAGPEAHVRPGDSVQFEAWCRYHYLQARSERKQLDLLSRVAPRLKVVTGPMWSGKTRTLIYELKRCEHAGLNVEAFKHLFDNRRFPKHKKELWSHSHVGYPARAVGTSAEIEGLIGDGAEVIGIDEGQFFDQALVHLVERLANSGKLVIVAGLDMNFRGEPFGPMAELIALADELDKRRALCLLDATADPTATRTQKLVNGRPASWNDDEIIAVDKNEHVKYEPRCRCHHEVLESPSPIFEGSATT